MSMLQAASARMSRQNSIESVGQAVVEETQRIIDYHNARVYILEEPDTLRPIAFAGTSERTRRSTWPSSRPGSVPASPVGPPSTGRRS